MSNIEDEIAVRIRDPRLRPDQAQAITDALRATREAQDPEFEGIRWEATPNGLVMMTSADYGHFKIVRGLRQQLEATLPKPSWEVGNDLEFSVGYNYGRQPDLFVLDGDERADFRGGRMTSASGVKLFVEVTSSNRKVDVDEKTLEYALARVPVYLLIDRKKREIAVYSNPQGGRYDPPVVTPIGKAVTLPAPLNVAVETEYMLEHVDED